MNEQELFSAALEQPLELRADFLNQTCRGDLVLQRRIERLLALHADGSRFLRHPAAAVLEVEILPHPDPEPFGTQIGPYRLREVLGEGGMGIVYLAEQEHPIRRKVALKVIKPGMDSREVIARLEAERQALALMEHPNIAKLLDAGAIGGFGIQDAGFSQDSARPSLNPELRLLDPQLGRPYFVMELVRGLPITDYCDQARLDLRERLKLFIQVCHAVQHAHQKGIIHRDLKPSNVMITLHDGVPVPKIIDFGVAKALNQRLTEHTIYTRHAQLLGTPMYMSPEQAELSGLDVDTRSDVYSLGVLLYELLTGHTPFDKETLSKAGFDEVRRMIREVEPSRPSQRISTLGQQHLSTVASHRGLDERHLSRSLRGELDWIVMRALEKDRTRRYGSADALAADVQHFLDDEPVQACPPSVTYRLRKLVHRQRALLGAIGLALITGIVAATVAFNLSDRQGAAVVQGDVPTESPVVKASQNPVDKPASLPQKPASESFLPELNSETAAIPEVGLRDRQGAAVVQDDVPPESPVDQNPAEKPQLLPQESSTGSFLPGLIPQPAAIPGIGRWQLMSRLPRLFVHQNWKLAWSPDSRQIAFGDGNDVRVYSVPELELVQVYSGHESSVVAVDWSPDGTTIASCSLDHTVRLWDAETGVPGLVLAGHTDRIDTVAWHPDSKRLASGSRDSTVRVWNKDGTAGPVLRGHAGNVYSVAWDRSGLLLATTGEDGTICIWGTDGSQQQQINTGRAQQTIAWGPDGEHILTAQFFSAARIWNLDGSPGVQFTGHTDAVTSAAFSPDGKKVASASWDDTVRLWDITGTPGPVLRGFEGNVYSVAWSPDGDWIAAAGVDRTIRLFRPDGQPGPVLTGSPRVICLEWAPDGDTFAASVSDGTIRICNSDGEEVQKLAGASNALTLDWSNDGRQIVGGCWDKTIRLWDVKSGAVLSQFRSGRSELTSVVWHPHLPLLAVASRSDPVCVWKTEGTLVSGWAASQGHVSELAWNPVDDRLAAVAYGTLRLWNSDGTDMGEFTSDDPLVSVAWKPDGTQLATGSETGAIQLWQPDGRPGLLLKGHSDRANSVAWSTDGSWLASGGRDNTVRIWSADGKERAVLHGHVGQASTVRWRPHASEVLSGSSDGTILLWSLDAEHPEWIAVMLRGGQSIRLDSAGRLLSGDEYVLKRAFAYLVEQPTGAIEVITPFEFERRQKQATRTPEDSSDSQRPAPP
jgi:eukaryotic-like serine/threonine-protein kinase